MLLALLAGHFAENLRKYLTVFGVAMLPVVELRGAIPIGKGLGLSYPETLVCALMGNMLPIPFGIVFLRRFLEFLSRKSEFLKKRIDKKVDKSIAKHDPAKYASAFILLAVFVAIPIPLPGTGAWTGALICAFLGVRVRDGFPPIAVGVIGAGAIVTALTAAGFKLMTR
ncbi:MAG: small multi-drug export protein [Oscillospiraceae bacterium]|nr:small multi-drug export protein [Oscillospiraceae bacterium]